MKWTKKGLIGWIESSEGWFDRFRILLVCIGIVVLFGGLLAYCFGNYLKKYCLESKRSNSSVILTEFMKEKKEIASFDENSPLIKYKNETDVL